MEFWSKTKVQQGQQMCKCYTQQSWTNLTHDVELKKSQKNKYDDFIYIT